MKANHPIELGTIVNAPNPAEMLAKTMEYLLSLEKLRQQMLDLNWQLQEMDDTEAVRQARAKLDKEYSNRFGQPPVLRTL